jgi:demethylmenaquinone methyltransferase/2-methoxy-6-polyprenyl-1,4-benzoquinol methylase
MNPRPPKPMTDRADLGNHIVHAPHPPLTDYYPSEAQRRNWVQRMFDGTAADYDRIERFVGLGSGSWYRGAALLRAGLKPGMKVLDIGVGTGLVSRQVARIVGVAELVTGIDPSPGMLRNAQVPAGVKLVRGSVEHLPFADASFDFVTMGYALRHIADLSVAFAECARVLRPGGRYCILEITHPDKKFHATLLKGYLRGVVPWFARLTSRNSETPILWNYYWDTIAACAPPSRVMHTLEDAGFGKVDRHVELGIFSEYRSDKPLN